MSNMRNLPARMVREVRKAMMHDDVIARKVFTTTLLGRKGLGRNFMGRDCTWWEGRGPTGTGSRWGRRRRSIRAT
jgi:hypothetical protein